MSTNKVYGDVPNEIPMNELETRWDYADPARLRRRRRETAASTAACTASSAPAKSRPT